MSHRATRPPAASDAATGPDERRRRRARIFGEVLPDVTGDERVPEEAGTAIGATAGDSTDPDEEWLRRQVPPHHG